MAGISRSSAQVLVVHCIDTEGPIGGNVRKRPDGTPEFMDTWPKISRSIRRLTSPSTRASLADSAGKPYRYNWFIMDFTGFRTNPKKRAAKYHDTYDHFKSFPTKPDGFYWHYHHPPQNGRGDAWSDRWDSSEEYHNILLHRLVEREDFPEAFRAGGTIEDNAASHWLEDNIMIDYSNRVSAQSRPNATLADFDWYGAPRQWGYYHPHRNNFLEAGKMRRYIVRSVDLWSRLHVLSVDEIREAFATAATTKQPVLLSYFSHDHREMFDETRYAVSMLNQVAKETGVPWRTSLALPALQRIAGLSPVKVSLRARHTTNGLQLSCNRPLYQALPLVGASLASRRLTWLPVTQTGPLTFTVSVPRAVRKVVIGGTSLSGNKFVTVVKL